MGQVIEEHRLARPRDGVVLLRSEVSAELRPGRSALGESHPLRGRPALAGQDRDDVSIVEHVRDRNLREDTYEEIVDTKKNNQTAIKVKQSERESS